MLPTAHLREVDEHLSRWLARLRLRDALSWSVRGLIGGMAAGLGLSLLARLRPLLAVPALLAFSLSLALIGFALTLAFGYFWPRPRLRAARYFDRLFGLAERTSAALELAAARDSIPDWLIRDQWADAAAAARAADPRRRLPFTLLRSDALLLLGVMVALALSLYLPNPQQITLAQQQAVQQAIAEQIKQIEAIREEIRNDPNLTDEQKAELTRPLDEAQKQLEEGDLTQEQAVQILTQAGQDLKQLADPNAQAQAEALEQAGQGLSQNATTQPVGEALANGDLQGAAQALENIDPAQLTEAERQALADQLEQTAQQLQNSNSDLAAQLQAAAAALRQGDVEAARAALQEAARTVAETGQAAAQAQAANQAAGEVTQAQSAVAQAGGSQPGQGQGQGQGQGDGQGQGNTVGNGDGQGGGTEGSGTQEGGNTDGQQAGGTQGGEASYESIYSPYGIDNRGEDVTVGSDNGDPGNEVVGEGTANPSDAGDVTVPYNEVFADYSDAAYSAIDDGEVPANLADVVKQYFTSLEP